MNTTQNLSTGSGTSLRQAALTAGIGLLLMAIIAIYANFGILPKLIVEGDAAATTNNIMASQGLFRMGIFSFLVVAVLDVIVAWALFVLLKPVNSRLSLLAAWFRIVYTAIFIAALNNHFDVIGLLSGADYLTAFDMPELQAKVMLSLDAFTNGWSIGLFVFGMHLLVLGYLAFRSDYIHKVFGILLMIAGIGYLFDTLKHILFPGFGLSLTIFTGIGEIVFIFWLLIRGSGLKEVD